MSNISKITLPDGTTYDLVAQAVAASPNHIRIDNDSVVPRLAFQYVLPDAHGIYGIKTRFCLNMTRGLDITRVNVKMLAYLTEHDDNAEEGGEVLDGALSLPRTYDKIGATVAELRPPSISAEASACDVITTVNLDGYFVQDSDSHFDAYIVILIECDRDDGTQVSLVSTLDGYKTSDISVCKIGTV